MQAWMEHLTDTETIEEWGPGGCLIDGKSQLSHVYGIVREPYSEDGIQF